MARSIAVFSSGTLSTMPINFAGVPLEWYTALRNRTLPTRGKELAQSRLTLDLDWFPQQLEGGGFLRGR
jgi:hypothetical protein